MKNISSRQLRAVFVWKLGVFISRRVIFANRHEMGVPTGLGGVPTGPVISCVENGAIFHERRAENGTYFVGKSR